MRATLLRCVLPTLGLAAVLAAGGVVAAAGKTPVIVPISQQFMVVLVGAWGAGPFDNDEATDWYLDLIETNDLSLVEEALDAGIVANETFDISDMDSIAAACEAVLGLLAPEEFARRSDAGPKHVDPLADGLGAVRDRQAGSGANFSIPGRLVDWVKRHRHLDAKPLLVSASKILNHVKARGAPFYEGYFRTQRPGMPG
jgi:hypothetical protein